ncbi:MAG: hypothetical protein ACOC9P_02780 [bacterium]
MSDSTTPIPPRFRWLKRLVLAGVLLLVAVGGLRWYWGHVMSGQLDAAVQAIEQRGEPIRLKNLGRPSIPDQDNSAVHLRKALAQWPRVDGQLITETD